MLCLLKIPLLRFNKWLFSVSWRPICIGFLDLAFVHKNGQRQLNKHGCFQRTNLHYWSRKFPAIIPRRESFVKTLQIHNIYILDRVRFGDSLWFELLDLFYDMHWGKSLVTWFLFLFQQKQKRNLIACKVKLHTIICSILQEYSNLHM